MWLEEITTNSERRFVKTIPKEDLYIPGSYKKLRNMNYQGDFLEMRIYLNQYPIYGSGRSQFGISTPNGSIVYMIPYSLEPSVALPHTLDEGIMSRHEVEAFKRLFLSHFHDFRAWSSLVEWYGRLGLEKTFRKDLELYTNRALLEIIRGKVLERKHRK